MHKRALILLLPALLGCGSDSPPPAPSKPKETTTSSVPAPPLPSPSPPVAAPPIPEPAAPEPPKAAATPAPAPVKADAGGEFAPDVVGGKSIGKWVAQLDSGNKNEVLEALAALQMVGKKAENAAPKITELSKSSDKDIAQEAATTLKGMGK